MYELIESEKGCQFQDVVMEVLTVLIGLENGFKEQMQGRMPAGMKWSEVNRYWEMRTRFAGVDMYQIKGWQLNLDKEGDPEWDLVSRLIGERAEESRCRRIVFG